MDHHISIVGSHVRAWPENDVKAPRGEDRYHEPDHNEGPARERRGKLIDFLHLPVLRLSILLLRLIVVLACRSQVRFFVPRRLGGSRLEFGCILCHTRPSALQRGYAAGRCGPATSSP